MKETIRILLIDDDEEDFLIVQDILSEARRFHYDIAYIDDYKQAKASLQQKNYDAVLLDYRLGVETGLNLLEDLKAIELHGPVILLTGQEDEGLDEKAQAMGIADFIPKSKLDSELLDRSIRYNLEQFNNLRKIYSLNKSLEKRVEERTAELSEAVKQLEERNKSLKDEIKRRKETEEALHESQQIYNAITSNFPNGSINIFDRSYTYIFSDGMELKSLGIDRKSIAGVRFFDHISKAQGEYFKEHLDKVFDGKNVMFEFQLNDRYFMIYGVPLRDKNDEVEHAMAVAQNITDQKNSAEKTRQALQKERQLNELKSRFVSMASHEFRTPLASILSSISLIDKYREREELEPQVKHIQKIKNNINLLTQILNDFLSIGKLEEGKVKYQAEEVDISSLTKDIIGDVQAVAKPGQNITLECNFNSIVAQLDPQVFRNVLYNLISNATKYSPDNKSIEVCLTSKASEIILTVTDHGIGIPEKDQPLLFDRFFRASNAGNIQGTGLGLNIVKKYVDLMGGTITFTSEIEEGTTFTVALPK